eukprot:1143341-Pelagomonas_calceolata.AAC.3
MHAVPHVADLAHLVCKISCSAHLSASRMVKKWCGCKLFGSVCHSIGQEKYLPRHREVPFVRVTYVPRDMLSI